MKLKRIGFLVIGLTGVAIVAFFLYQNGYIGANTIKNLFIEKVNNPYNGVYLPDESKIESKKILSSFRIAKEKNFEPPYLTIEGSGASLLGYQYNSRVRNRFFTVCLKDNKLVLNNGELGYFDDDYCKIPFKSDISLKLKFISSDTLFCENCEKEEFPRYWIKSNLYIRKH